MHGGFDATIISLFPHDTMMPPFFSARTWTREKSVGKSLCPRSQFMAQKNVSFAGFFFRKKNIFYSLDLTLSFDQKNKEDFFWGEKASALFVGTKMHRHPTDQKRPFCDFLAPSSKESAFLSFRGVKGKTRSGESERAVSICRFIFARAERFSCLQFWLVFVRRKSCVRCPSVVHKNIFTEVNYFFGNSE